MTDSISRDPLPDDVDALDDLSERRSSKSADIRSISSGLMNLLPDGMCDRSVRAGDSGRLRLRWREVSDTDFRRDEVGVDGREMRFKADLS